MREKCLRSLKDRLIERANIIQVSAPPLECLIENANIIQVGGRSCGNYSALNPGTSTLGPKP